MTAQSSTQSAVVTLPSDTEILITRGFDAPRHLVFRAYTEPDLIKRWWHANRGHDVSIGVDLRVGGEWRYVMTANSGGFEVAFHGVYHEIVPDERLVTTEVYEGAPDHPARTTLTLADDGGRTTMQLLVEHDSRSSRDMHVDSGMEDGLQDALDLLNALAVDLA